VLPLFCIEPHCTLCMSDNVPFCRYESFAIAGSVINPTASNATGKFCFVKYIERPTPIWFTLR
jgi:hypothetical protein